METSDIKLRRELQEILPIPVSLSMAQLVKQAVLSELNSEQHRAIQKLTKEIEDLELMSQRVIQEMASKIKEGARNRRPLTAEDVLSLKNGTQSTNVNNKSAANQASTPSKTPSTTEEILPKQLSKEDRRYWKLIKSLARFRNDCIEQEKFHVVKAIDLVVCYISRGVSKSKEGDCVSDTKTDNNGPAMEDQASPQHQSYMSILDTAKKIVHGDRNKIYGHPLGDYTCNGKVFAALISHWLYTHHPEVLTQDIPALPAEIAIAMMIAVKNTRLISTPEHRDTVTDIAGYAECAAWSTHERKRRIVAHGPAGETCRPAGEHEYKEVEPNA